jgi:hypothetical protein
MGQKVELRGRERDRLAGHRDTPAHDVDLDGTEDERGFIEGDQ